MKKTYSFDSGKHQHMIGGVIVPGITTVIKPLTDYDSINRDVLRAACDWGTAVHKTVELFCSGRLDEQSLDDPLKPVLDGFIKWADEVGVSPCDFVCEVPMGDSRLMYGGIPDLILDTELIVEIKTRQANKLTDSIQTEAQERLWMKNGGKWGHYEHRVLELRQDGTYCYTIVNDRQAWPRFRKLLEHYQTTRLIKQWKELK